MDNLRSSGLKLTNNILIRVHFHTIIHGIVIEIVKGRSVESEHIVHGGEKRGLKTKQFVQKTKMAV